MHGIESEPGELHSRQLLCRDSRARRVFLVVQIPRTDGSPRATADEQALRRIHLHLTTAAGDFPKRLRITAGRAIKDQHRAAARHYQKVANRIDGDVWEALSFRRGEIKSRIRTAENSLRRRISV